jgi:hypothetical protein
MNSLFSFAILLRRLWTRKMEHGAVLGKIGVNFIVVKLAAIVTLYSKNGLVKLSCVRDIVGTIMLG